MSPTVDDEEVNQRTVAAILAALGLVRVAVWLSVGWALITGYNAVARWTQRRALA
jgi:hypothetical protein